MNNIGLMKPVRPEARRKVKVAPKSRAPKKIKLKSINHKAISRSLHFIEENYLRPIPVFELVKVSGMTRRGFIGAFCRHVGQPPASFIRHMRIEQAAKLLIRHDWPIKTIAKRSGFKSDNTFCIAFNRITGMPPKKFQRHFWLSTCRKLNGASNVGGFLQ